VYSLIETWPMIQLGVVNILWLCAQ